jgi:hypothetical protein
VQLLPPAGDREPCFIATAAYGTELAPQIQILRKFREERLRSYAFGSTFIKGYELMSPPIAKVLARSPLMRAIMRRMFWPVIWLSRIVN